ncbi:hypothetical protein VTN31DRAFT_6212 [Thermomyces dupontii]|uniref:uncharacterized protein n=1 Tax=Talaromyces thermophilus TaxID=28565 RepID=UPI0037423822
MGCCFSAQSRDEGTHHESTGATNANHVASGTVPQAPGLRPPLEGPSQSSHHAASDRRRRRASRINNPDPVPLKEHYNQPIRPHIWRSKRRIWTPSSLAREREEFFETRVSGRPEVWDALRVALSFMRDGDLETAQSIIDAAGVTVPTGDLCEGCYDESGALYRLPQCIVSDPVNMVPDPPQEEGLEEHPGSEPEDDNLADSKMMADGSDEEFIPDDDEARRREEKGKISARDLISVTARLSDPDAPDVTVTVGRSQPVSVVARKVHQEAKLPATQRVRILYLGRMLREQESLVSQGWQDKHLINAFITETQSKK